MGMSFASNMDPFSFADAPKGLTNAFAKGGRSSTHLRLATYDHEAQQTDTGNTDIDTYDIAGPTPYGDSVFGYIRRIENLLNMRQSTEAIALALHVLNKHEALPDLAADKIKSQIEEGYFYVETYGTTDEARNLKLQILSHVNLSNVTMDSTLDMGSSGMFPLLSPAA